MMKKNVLVVTVLIAAAGVHAVPDIQFSPVTDSPSVWFYDGSNTFSFSQSISIDSVLGGTTDALHGNFVFLPNLTLSNYAYYAAPFDIGISDVSANGGSVEIKDGGGNILLAGTLSDGKFRADGATANFFSNIALDILVTEVNPYGSVFLGGVSVGDYFDFNLTLQGNLDMNTMIQQNQQGSNGFSGSMTTIIPEPATLSLLGLGGLAFLRRRIK